MRAKTTSVLAVIAGLQLSHLATAAATFERVSVSSNGTQANSFSMAPAITPDGRFVAFISAATNLVARPTSGTFDVYVHDRLTGLTTLESVGMNGAPSNNGSILSAISADGRFVAFTSSATNLTPGVTRVGSQVYVRDRLLGTTTLVSVTPGGTAGNNQSQINVGQAISWDGRYVTFWSAASDLVPNDTNGKSDVFTRDLQTGTTIRESVATDGTQGTSDSISSLISGDGRFVVFSSQTSLVPGSPASGGVFVRDRVTGQLTFESIDPAGMPFGGNATGAATSISGDGRFISLIGGLSTVYLRDLQTRQTITVSTDASLTDVRVNSDGRYVFYGRRFDSTSLLVYDRTTGQTVPFTSGLSPSAGTNAVAFETTAALVPEDTNGQYDIYVFGEPLRSGAPGAPTGLTASSSGSSVTLTWTAPATGAATTSYIIEAGSSPGAANLANFSTGSTATTFSTSGVASGTYYVRVRASNSSGTSAASNEVTLIVGGGCAGPTAPSNLAAAVSGNTVTLTWAAGNGATSYLLLVGSGPGRSDILVSDLRSAATMLTASNVTAGTYFVRVQALNACGQSAPSNETVVTVR